MRVEWLPTARASARRFMADQAGMRAIGIAVAQLSESPYPPEAFRWGELLRLRVGPYRIMYTVEGDLITILRVERRAE
ncbi:MAG TPA: type II toxin-antitoxin system RelE/ParE family toxin [Streptosporangiaceae bacterium]|nr:type II toxin-antitoxin system RelE/ParE family toxin [Streptosporangiaceae bacterium]